MERGQYPPPVLSGHHLQFDALQFAKLWTPRRPVGLHVPTGQYMIGLGFAPPRPLDCAFAMSATTIRPATITNTAMAANRNVVAIDFMSPPKVAK